MSPNNPLKPFSVRGKKKEAPSMSKTALEAFKIALNGLDSRSLMAIEVVEQKYENAEVLNELADRMNRLRPIVTRLHERGHADLTHFFSKLVGLFEELSTDLQHANSQGTLRQFIHSKDNALSLEKCRKKIDAIIHDANLALTADIWDHLKLEDERARFAMLNPSHEAAFNSQDRSDSHSCQEGTRCQVREKLHEWVKSEESKLFWIHGPAGAGKTTIAHTIAEDYHATNNLGATFFFSRDEQSHPSRRNGKLLLQTIAYQLGCKYPLLRKAISNVLADPNVITQRWQDQLEKLVLQPISKTMALLPQRLVVVIDALDECQDKTIIFQVIEAIADGLRNGNISYPLRFLITSRAEFDIYHHFKRPKIHSGTNAFDLYSIEPVNADSDVRIFFTQRLEELPNREAGWPSPEDIQFLVKISEGLFIAASMLLRFLDSKRHRPKLRYDELRSGKTISGLDSIYKQILSSAISGMETTQETTDFRTVIGTVILASTRLTVRAMGDLLQMDVEGSLEPILATLRPVIHVPDTEEGVVHTFHSTFHDFLVDSVRCTDDRFFIESAEHHKVLARFCLESMTTKLRRDICNMQLHTKKNMDGDVQEKVKSLPGDLIYACRYWGGHFAKSKPDELIELLEMFASEHLFSWVEVLCVVGDLNGGVVALKTARRKLLSVNHVPRILTNLLSDAARLLVDFHDVLVLSAMHTYFTALPLSPKDSALYKQYGVKLKFAHYAATYHDTQWKKTDADLHKRAI